MGQYAAVLTSCLSNNLYFFNELNEKPIRQQLPCPYINYPTLPNLVIVITSDSIIIWCLVLQALFKKVVKAGVGVGEGEVSRVSHFPCF